jgi:hypothetical protein
MNDLGKLKQKELEIKLLKYSIASLSDYNKPKRITRKIKELSLDQDTAVMNYMESNDKKYFELAEQNFELLENDNIEFLSKSESWGIVRSFEKRFKGSVHDNGFFYANTVKTNFIIFNFQRHLYPKQFNGFMNYLGEGEVNVTKTGFRFFGSRVPQNYIGSIDRNGNLEFHTAETYWEPDGITYVTSIIADLFSGNHEKRRMFLQNKDSLYSMISDFRSRLL